ncbi:MAG: MFS transporter [Pseudomonadota bacterium]
MAGSNTQSRPYFYGYTLVGYSFAICFLASAFFLHARGVFFPHWIADFGVSKTELSLAVSLTLFTGSCCAPLTGFLIDRLPLRYIICFACCWLTVGYLLMRGVDTYLGLLLVLIPFQGIGWTGVGPLVQTKLMVNWFSRNRGMALGVALMGMSVAGVIIPPLNTFLAENYGWRNAYAVYAGCLIFIAIPLTLLLVRQKPDDIGQHPDGEEPDPSAPAADAPNTTGTAASGWSVYREFLTSSAYWSVVLTFGLMNGVYSAMVTHLPTYLTTELTFSLYDGAYLLTIAGAFAIGGKIVFGWMMDHLPAKITVMAGVVAYIFSTITLIFAQSYALLMVAAALFGLGFGGMVPVRSVIISRLFGIDKFSRANGLLSFFLAPATFWVLLTGYIVDQIGTYTAAFQVWTVAFALAGCVSLIVKLPNHNSQPLPA